MNLIGAKLWLTTVVLIPLSGTVVLSSTASGDTIQCIGEAYAIVVVLVPLQTLMS
jgi:hypothetical protein